MLMVWFGCTQLTELKNRCTKLENQCKAKHAAGERSKALNNFNDKYNSVRLHGVFGSRALALADPYCHIAWNSVGVCVCLCVRNFEVKYLGNQRS